MKIKCLRSGRGEYFTSNKFKNFCEDNRIRRHVSTSKTPQQNEVAKRRNKIVSEVAREMMIEGNVAHVYWREVVSTTI